MSGQIVGTPRLPEGSLTLADVLAMPAVRAADPLVVAASSRLASPVRWVHTTELVDVGPLLRGGDLVLTTGIALPDNGAALSGFARSLADSSAAGLLLELGRRWTSVPEPLVSTCEELGLPLVALRREVRFANVAQAVGERLVDAQLRELRETHRVHETFTDLSIAEAGPDEVLAAVQRLSGAAVVLEDEQHRVLDYRGGPEDVGAFLDDWERRSRLVAAGERTSWDASNGWVVTRIGRPERAWGRLVIDSPGPPSQRLVAVAERGAAALAMHRLHDRHQDSRVRRIHHELLLAVLAGPADSELLRRISLAGVPADGHTYVGLALRPAADRFDDVVAACLRAAEVVSAHCLVATFESEVRVLLAVPSRSDAASTVDRLVAEVSVRVPVVASAGTPLSSFPAAGRTLREALQVLSALAGRSSPGPAVHRLEDLHLRGLLTLLADDERVRAFSERELAPLLDHPTLLDTLRVVIEDWGSKSAAAARLNVSRPVLYDRIARLERLLGASLSDPEVRTSLHVALIASERN